MPYQKTGRAVVLVRVQRRMGLRGGLCGAHAGLGGFGAGRKGTLAARRGAISEIEATIPASGSSLPSWLFVLRTAWNGQDFPGVCPGGAFWVVRLHCQSFGFQ